MGFAAIGAEVLRARKDAEIAGTRPAYGQRYPSSHVGWVAPTDLFSQARNIDQAATSFDASVVANVSPTSTYYQSWKAWLANWRTYFANIGAGGGVFSNPISRAVDLSHTDGIKAQLDTYWQQLSSFQSQYAAQTNAGGQPVPPLSGTVIPPSPPTPPPPQSSWNPFSTGTDKIGTSLFALIPWWVYAGALAVGGLAVYSVYRSAKAADDTRKELTPAFAKFITGGRDQGPPVHVHVTAAADPNTPASPTP